MTTESWDLLWTDVHLATMQPGGEAYGAIRNGALAVTGNRIAWLGPRSALPDAPQRLAHEVRDGQGRWLLPGLIDCHTHAVYGGSRIAEFEQRLTGVSYEEIARAGGGILATVKATRDADEAELLRTAVERLRHLRDEGVTTVEIKSGYGLTTDDEMKMLRVARAAGAALSMDVRTTFLGAHALPPEYRDRRDAYVTLVCDEMLPRIAEAGLADAVDVYCERIAFSAAETDRILHAARAVGLAVKLHADQLSDGGGAGLVAAHRGLSADHLEYTSEQGVAAMAEADTVAVLLPGAFYTLRETKLPPVELFRRYRVPMALATDLNPGSSPVRSLLLMLNMGCTLFGLTPEEALAGVTRNAARALGLRDRGVLEVGARADLTLWRIESPAELGYHVGGTPSPEVIRA